MSIDLKILAYEETPLGILCLRQRLTLSQPQCWVTEVTLNHEFLMSSLHTDSERALAKFAIDRVEGENLQVLVGGLGLGYTAAAVLESPRVAKVEVIELLPQVIGWMNSGLIPLSESLQNDQRLVVTESDIYAHLLSDSHQRSWDVILIDVDHSPDDKLSDGNDGFYMRGGLASAANHLRAGGVLALWSYENNDTLKESMVEVFEEVDIIPVHYTNQHVGESFTDWLFLGKTLKKC